MMKNATNPGHRQVAFGITSGTMNRWILLLGFSVTAAGCAIGQSEYSCSGIPEGVQCHNAREVLEASRKHDGPITNKDFDGKHKSSDKEDAGAGPGKSTSEQGSGSGLGATSVAYVPDEETGALPLRTQSRVMRIWYAPWETASGDLHISKIVYTEVETRRWSIGRSASVNVVRDITPLEPASPGRAAPATPRTTAATSAVPVAPSAEIVPTGANAAATGGGFPNP